MSHEYALVLRDDETAKDTKGDAHTTEADQLTGNPSAESTETVPSATGQTTGSGQTETAGQTTESSQNNTGNTAEETTPPQSSGTQQIQIDKPVLNNLP